VSTVAPLSATVVAAVNRPVEFQVGRTIGALQMVTWSLDGRELPASSDGATFVCCDTVGSHVLEVRVHDSSGLIRRADDRTEFRRAWTITTTP
jgi:hypothetical protein